MGRPSLAPLSASRGGARSHRARDPRATPLDLYDYPWSHSLIALSAWGLLFAAAHWARKRDAAAALLLFFAVISHWFLDVAMHRPDLPVFLRGPYVGLGLWNSIPATLAVEGAVYAIGIGVYVGATRPTDRKASGRSGFS